MHLHDPQGGVWCLVTGRLCVWFHAGTGGIIPFPTFRHVQHHMFGSDVSDTVRSAEAQFAPGRSLGGVTEFVEAKDGNATVVCEQQQQYDRYPP